MATTPIRDVSLFVKMVGQGYPILIMHGGPGADHSTMLPLQDCADQFTLIFYDHRCNGRSEGAEVSSMTWENLTADAEALRQTLGFEKWAVLGHSFGGMVALEYALRYPQSVSHLLLMDTCGDIRWVQQNAPELLAKRGFNAGAVRAARRFFAGQLTPGEFLPTMMKFSKAYYYRSNFLTLVRQLFSGGFQVKTLSGSTDLCFQPAAPGLVGDGAPQGYPGAHAGLSRAARFSVSTGTPGHPGRPAARRAARADRAGRT